MSLKTAFGASGQENPIYTNMGAPPSGQTMGKFGQEGLFGEGGGVSEAFGGPKKGIIERLIELLQGKKEPNKMYPYEGENIIAKLGKFYWGDKEFRSLEEAKRAINMRGIQRGGSTGNEFGYK